MANLDTLKKTARITDRIVEIADAFHVGPISIGPKEGVIRLRRGAGRSLEPGILEKAYRELPKETVIKFAAFTGEGPAPSKREFASFETTLLGAVRRVFNQEFKKRISKLPPPVGRRKRKAELTRMILASMKAYKAKGWSTTAAAKQTAIDLKRNRATIWRHLASKKKALAR